MNEEQKDFKKKYYSLIKAFTAIERNMCDRCPSMMRNCCAGCNLIKLKLKDIKNGNFYDEGENGEFNSSD